MSPREVGREAHHPHERPPRQSSETTGTSFEAGNVDRRAKTLKKRPVSAAAPGRNIMPVSIEKTEPKMTTQTCDTWRWGGRPAAWAREVWRRGGRSAAWAREVRRRGGRQKHARTDG